MTHLREQAAAVERRSPGHIRQATKLRSSSSTAGFRAADLSNTWIPPHARFPSTQMSRPSETNATMYEMAVVLDRETHAPPGSRSRVAPPDEASVQELPPVDGGCKAWRFCMSAFVLEAYVWGFGFSYGIFQEYYTSHPPFNTESPVTIAAVGTTALAVQYSELSLFFQRYPDLVQASMWLGLGLCFMCLLLASFISEVWQLIMLQGVIFGVGGGLLYFPTMLLLPQWFVRRRGLAAGIIFSGSGLGGFVFPLVLNALLERVGFRWTLRIWATTMLLVCAVALLGIQPRVPIPMFQEGQGRPRFIPPQMQFVKTPLFWNFGAATVLQAMSYFPVSLYIATFARIVSSPLSATIALSIFNSTTVVGQILIGHLCDRLPYAWVMFASALGSGIAAFLLWGFTHTLPLVFFFAIVFGSLSGGFSSVAPVAAADCAGSKPEQLGIICACSFLLKGIAVVVGPVLSGILYNVGKSSSHNTHAHYGFFGFGPIEIFVGTCAIATSITSILVAAARQRPLTQ